MTQEMENENLSFTQQLRKDGFIKDIDTNPTCFDDTDSQNQLPIIFIPNTILLPHTDITLNLDKQHTDNLLHTVDDNNHGIILTPKKLEEGNGNGNVEFYDVGVILEIKSLTEDKENELLPEEYVLELKVKDKVYVNKILKKDGFFHAQYKILPEENTLTEDEITELNKNIDETVLEIAKFLPNTDKYTRKILGKLDTQDKLAEVFPFLKVPINKKQELLELDSVKIRALKVIQLLLEQKDAIGIQMELAKKLNKKMNETHKNTLLREQMKLIQEELNMTDDTPAHKTYRERIKDAQLPKEVEEAALEEVTKLERQGQNNAEENIIRNYLDTILQLPWHKEENPTIDIVKAKKQLNDDHYGLKKVKTRIIQHLTVLKMKKDKQGSILLFVGPPGTGKTSLGKSIAAALERPYVRVSLGGVNDESEIRGHRRTYLGALPGRIINGMKKAGKTNPVFVLDEIDKMTESLNGNPTSALLEVLDPEQNDSFSDNYLEVPYDLSDVFFIGTANSLQDIPGPLRDRLEIIELDSYTNTEKHHIADEHLIKEVLLEHGLTEDDLKITYDAIDCLIEKYTRESGVRGLKREIAAIARYVTEKIVVDNVERPYVVDENMLYDILGHEKSHYDKVPDSNPPGVVTGLAWTPIGGDILFIEAVLLPGEEKLKLTGQLGDVMKESAQIAQSLIKSRLATVLKDSDIEKRDIHIHVPAGSIPKDGPSAGVTLLTTIASLVTNTPVDSTLAMTGEISLRGKVLPVGGIKEKVIAAHRSGIKTVLLPEENMKDLDDVPCEVKDDMTFKSMKTVDEVLYEALGLKLPENKPLNISIDEINKVTP